MNRPAFWGAEPGPLSGDQAAEVQRIVSAPLRDLDAEVAAARRATNGDPFEETGSILPHALDLGTFLESEIVSPEMVLEPFLPIGGSGILFSIPGVAKTWLAHRLAFAVAKGEPWLGFEVPKPRRVLLIDGELSMAVLHKRLKAVANGEEYPRPGMMSVLCAEELMQRRGRPLDLGDEIERNTMLEDIWARSMDSRPELVILDNLAALWAGLDENDNGKVGAEVNRWIAQLRFLRCAVLLVHHASKEGIGRGPRGGSALTGPVDFVIGLHPKPKALSPHFTLTFTKQRHERVPHPEFEIELEPGPNGMAFKVHGPGSDSKAELLRFIADNPPKSQRDLSRKTGIPDGTLRRRLGELRRCHYLDGLTVTPEGCEYAGIAE